MLDSAGTSVATFGGSGLAFSTEAGGRDAAAQSVPDGSYRAVATASDTWGNPPVTAQAVIHLDGTPPGLVLTGTPSEPTLVSPNGDGLNETARLAFSLSVTAPAVASVRDAAGATVRTLTLSAPVGPGAIAWDGLGVAGERLPDGPCVPETTARDATGSVSPGSVAPAVVATARRRVAAAPPGSRRPAAERTRGPRVPPLLSRGRPA